MAHRFSKGQGEADALTWFAAEQVKSKPHIVIGLGDMLAAADLTSDLGRLSVPLLIIGPDSSPFIAPSYFARLKEMIPSSELLIVPGTKHGLPFSHARQLSKHLAKFIDGRVEQAS